jgi:hypothetical protein
MLSHRGEKARGTTKGSKGKSRGLPEAQPLALGNLSVMEREAL